MFGFDTVDEFTHHVESLAGEKDLEKKDAEYLADYLRNNRRHEKFID